MAFTKQLLITESQLKDNTTINSNLDNEFLSSQIYYCQERYIKPLLGDDLYHEVLNQLSTSALTSLNSTLLSGHVQNILINYSASEVLPLIHYKIDNIGIHNRMDSNFIPVKHEEIELLALQFKNQATFFAEQMTLYLFKNQTDYPLYLNGNTTIDKMKPSLGSPRSAFYLGNKSRMNIFSKGKNND